MTLADDIATVRSVVVLDVGNHGQFMKATEALDRIVAAVTVLEDEIESLEVELSGSALSERQHAEAAVTGPVEIDDSSIRYVLRQYRLHQMDEAEAIATIQEFFVALSGDPE